ncbi:MAG TPA: hypothetical protein VGN61_05980 [Verrucomicrobiae bacterium]
MKPALAWHFATIDSSLSWSIGEFGGKFRWLRDKTEQNEAAKMGGKILDKSQDSSNTSLQ